uniref:E3 ubiquitin-protein ligase PPP1R11 n=1 Tax=Romanomermis culicivorax TaxID=13658 RepID=A0A915KQL2_ROMCU
MCSTQQASCSEEASTVTEASEEIKESTESVCLHLRRPEDRNGVTWSADTVDNEHFDKKKSKCCCIYTKNRAWDESSSGSSTEMECDDCYGHVEAKKKKKTGKKSDSPPENEDNDENKANEPSN